MFEKCHSWRALWTLSHTHTHILTAGSNRAAFPLCLTSCAAICTGTLSLNPLTLDWLAHTTESGLYKWIIKAVCTFKRAPAHNNGWQIHWALSRWLFVSRGEGGRQQAGTVRNWEDNLISSTQHWPLGPQNDWPQRVWRSSFTSTVCAPLAQDCCLCVVISEH